MNVGADEKAARAITSKHWELSELLRTIDERVVHQEAGKSLVGTCSFWLESGLQGELKTDGLFEIVIPYCDSGLTKNDRMFRTSND